MSGCRLQGKRISGGRFSSLVLASVVVLCTASVTHAAGLIPGTFPVSSGSQLEVKETVTVNGTTVNVGKTGADSVIQIDGIRATVNQALPSLEPPTFPANSSNIVATEADSPFVSSTEIFFKEIKIEKNQSATFSGGGPFHIDELKLEDDATINLAGGTYFIKKLSMDKKRTQLIVTSEPVILHIGDEFKLSEEDIKVNAGGSVTGLRVFLHDDAEVKGEKGLEFTGLLYGPQAKKVELKEDVIFRGAIIIDGEIKLEKDITLIYTTADQVAVSAINTDGSGGGDIIPPVVTAPVDITVPAVDANGTPASDPAIQVFLNGASALDDVDGPISPTNNAPPNFPVGSTLVAFSATDTAGNSATVSATVIVENTPPPDTIPPSLSIITPGTGTFVFQKRPTINVSYSDENSGVNTESFILSVNGNPLQVACTFGNTTGQCTPQADFPEGAVTLVAFIEDEAGNPTSTQSAVVVDTIPVEISLTTPVDGFITQEAEIQVTGAVGANITAITVNGIDATPGSTFTVAVPLREGTNMIVAVATKDNGKTGAASLEVTRDVVAPIVRIDSPRNGFIAVTDVVTVVGQVNDIVNGATDAQVRVNGLEATVANGAFMVIDVPLVRGPNILEATATDAVGNVSQHSITVTFKQPVGARMEIASGNGQAGVVNQPLAQPMIAQVIDEVGNPVAGRIVTFTVTRNSGTLVANQGDSPTRTVQVPTNGSGQAAAFLTLGDSTGEGNNRILVTGLGVAGEAEFCASAVAAAPTNMIMQMGDNQRGVIGHPLPLPLEALVVDEDGNPINDVPVTFSVVKGTGSLDGQPTVERMTGTDGIARAVLTLGGEAGINNNIVSARFPGLAGLSATFVASGLLPGNPADTKFSGVVLDNAQTPIPGAEITINGTALFTTTDEEGQFLLENVPVGAIHLHIDPTNSPRSETFPPLEFETVTVAGQTNILGQPILIPALQTESSKLVGGSQDVVLTMPDVDGLELTVFANSVTCPDGSTQCQVSISQVHMDKVPMVPPGGRIFAPAWTIQPAGTHFDPPARIQIPNGGLPPGHITDIFQFDHALNQFVTVGKGTVSEDGAVIVSDPGFGILAAGWGGCGRPPQDDTCKAKACEDSDADDCKMMTGNTCPPGCQEEDEPDGKDCKHENGPGVCETGDCVCPIPVNFQETAGGDAGGGVLRFDYTWESSTGNLEDLKHCYVGERVELNATSFPPFLPPPDLVRRRLPGPTGGLTDFHTPAFVKPYSEAIQRLTQVYEYYCPCADNFKTIVLHGPLLIERSITRKPNGDFRLLSTKSGKSAPVDPLP